MSGATWRERNLRGTETALEAAERDGVRRKRPRPGRAPWREAAPRQIENDIPQPQVVVAFGLLITNRDP